MTQGEAYECAWQVNTTLPPHSYYARAEQGADGAWYIEVEQPRGIDDVTLHSPEETQQFIAAMLRKY